MLLKIESITLYFERVLLHFDSALLCFESILLYFATMLASGCIENQYSKEKVVINVHFKHANLLAVGDTTHAYFYFHFFFARENS